MKNLGENRGITLVALIVTIIILLILAGVTIALLSGEDGILSRTEKAATSYQTESIKEVVNLKLANLNAGKWIDEGRKAVLKDLNELDDENSSNFDSEITLKNPVGDTDTSAVLVYDQHEVEVDSSLNIAKIDGQKYEGTTGANTGSTSSGESGSTSGGNAGSIDSAEYTQMQATIAQMQEKINQLETESNATKAELTDTNTELDSVKNQVNNMLISLDVDTRTTLFEGTAGTANTDYTISDLSDYKYIIVYWKWNNGAGYAKGIPMMINVSDIIYNNSNTMGEGTYILSQSNQGASSLYVLLNFWFRSNTSFRVNSTTTSGGWSSVSIYKIEGIK